MRTHHHHPSSSMNTPMPVSLLSAISSSSHLPSFIWPSHQHSARLLCESSLTHVIRFVLFYYSILILFFYSVFHLIIKLGCSKDFAISYIEVKNQNWRRHKLKQTTMYHLNGVPPMHAIYAIKYTRYSTPKIQTTSRAMGW